MADLEKQFRNPGDSLGDLDAGDAARIIAAAADVALIIDADGIIRDFAFESNDMAQELQRQGSWIGQPWIDTVTVESRVKVETLLGEAASHTTPRWRHVNYPTTRGRDIPVLCAAFQIRNSGPVIVVGRDLRNLAALQQRLVEAQQSIEQDYARLRHVETRYRLLFQLSSEAVLIIDANSGRILDANPSACALMNEPAKDIVGRVFPRGFNAEGTRSVEALLEAVRVTGRPDEARATASDGTSEQIVTAYLFRQEGALLFLVRVRSAAVGADGTIRARRSETVSNALNMCPDGFVVSMPDGQIVAVNEAFLSMAELTAEEQARGETLDRWLGKPGVELNVLIANLRLHGSVRLFRATLLGEFGATTDVEISAAAVGEGDEKHFIFSIRDVGPRPTAGVPTGRELPHSVDQMTELVGRLSLKDIVRETTDVIERLCIQAALQLSRDNRAMAAEMLGLSRQSLYVKMRRFSLVETDDEAEKNE